MAGKKDKARFVLEIWLEQRFDEQPADVPSVGEELASGLIQALGQVLVGIGVSGFHERVRADPQHVSVEDQSDPHIPDPGLL